MRTPGSPIVLEYRRWLAVQRIDEGYSIQEVADFLGVAPSSVRRWVATFRRQGADGLAAQPVPGRPPRLTSTQEKIVCRWLAENPIEHGFATELWTAPRLAQLIEQEWGVHFNPNYLTTWLRRRGFTPQKPRRKARERDDDAIAQWLAKDWPRIKKRRGGGARTCC
jgi:transposase